MSGRGTESTFNLMKCCMRSGPPAKHPRAIAIEPLKGTGFSPYIAAMPKMGFSPRGIRLKKADLCEFRPSGAKAPPILAAYVRAEARTLPTFSRFSENDPNAIALPSTPCPLRRTVVSFHHAKN